MIMNNVQHNEYTNIKEDLFGASRLHASTRFVILVGILLVLNDIFLLSLKDVIPTVVSLYPISLPQNPYFVYDHIGLLYLLTPLVFLSSIIFLLLPGILITLVIGNERKLSPLILKGFGSSFILILISTSIVKLLSGGTINSAKFIFIVIILSIGSWSLLFIKILKGKKVNFLLADGNERRRLFWFGGIPTLLILFLLPVIFWQDFNPDGLEALLLGRSLSDYIIPRLPVGSGVMGLGLGMFTSAYPTHWFIMLFGPIEASARFPFLLYMLILFYSLVALIEWRRPRNLSFTEESVLFLSISVYAVTMCFNDAYHLYYADIASPASIDTLSIVSLVALAFFLISNQRWWFLLWVGIAYFTRPTGLLFLIIFGIGLAISDRSIIKDRWKLIVAAIGLCLLILIFYEKLYATWMVGGEEFLGTPSTGILDRLHFIKLNDYSRFLYILIPVGILPALSLLLFRLQDPIGRTITIISIIYFLFFYIQAFVALHHFVPAMIFPIVVFWRLMLKRPKQLRLLCVATLGVFISLLLSFPRDFHVDRKVRIIGSETKYLVGNYRDGNYSGYWKAFKHKGLLYSLFSHVFQVEDPSKEFICSPNAIIHYASQMDDSTRNINYVVQLISDPPPEGFSQIDDNGEAVVYVKNVDRWNSHRFQSFQTNSRSRLYNIPRETLFQAYGVGRRNDIINVREYIKKILKIKKNGA